MDPRYVTDHCNPVSPAHAELDGRTNLAYFAGIYGYLQWHYGLHVRVLFWPNAFDQGKEFECINFFNMRNSC